MYATVYIFTLTYCVLGTIHAAPAGQPVQSYNQLYPEQWAIGYCAEDCKYDIDTYCNRQDNFCQSCHIYCENGQAFANDEACQRICPALFAYQQQQHEQRTTTPSQRIKATTNYPSSSPRHITDNPQDLVDISIASATDTSDHQQNRLTTTPATVGDNNRSSEDQLIFHWLWLLLIPFILTISLVYCCKDSLKKVGLRLMGKLRNHTKAEEETKRFGTIYFALPDAPSTGSIITDQQTEKKESDETGESWPHPYSSTPV